MISFKIKHLSKSATKKALSEDFFGQRVRNFTKI